ncbi:MAG: riboflavin biosynthesis protein RibF [Eubacteriales bacterium]|nr:riboflavin biosynthesis protein RibF [Eubacteriales bacterium]
MSRENIRPCVLALGFFDGIHIGHAALMRRTKERSAELGIESAVITFGTHPDMLVHGIPVRLINSAAAREQILRKKFGIDRVIVLPFTEETRRIPWQEFAEMLRREYGAVHFVIGEDFRFGWRGEGCADRLSRYCAENGFGCDVIPPVRLDDVVVSSSHIRDLLLEGRIEEANRFLGHPHILTGEVGRGRHLGSRIGVPTVNLRFPEGVLQLPRGVYATRVLLPDGIWRQSVTNVGVHPTVCEEENLVVESCILDYDGNLYGCFLVVEFYSFLRPERRFDSVEELRTQIFHDEKTVRDYFGENPLPMH